MLESTRPTALVIGLGMEIPPKVSKFIIFAKTNDAITQRILSRLHPKSINKNICTLTVSRGTRLVGIICFLKMDGKNVERVLGFMLIDIMLCTIRKTDELTDFVASTPIRSVILSCF